MSSINWMMDLWRCVDIVFAAGHESAFGMGKVMLRVILGCVVAVSGVAISGGSAEAAPDITVNCPTQTNIDGYRVEYDPAENCVVVPTPQVGRPYDSLHEGGYVVQWVGSSLKPYVRIQSGGWWSGSSQTCSSGTQCVINLDDTVNGKRYRASVSINTVTRTSNAFTATISDPQAPVSSDPIAKTKQEIRKLVTGRANRIVSAQPHLVNRLSGGPFGGQGNPLGFAANGTLSSFSSSFQTSLRAVSSYARGAAPNAGLDAIDQNAGQLTPAQRVFTGFDVWTSGSYAHSKVGDLKSDSGILHIGADYRFNDRAVIGILGQLDYSESKNSVTNVKSSGFGWMVGPYGVIKIREGLYIDGRAAYGQSDNQINPVGTSKDKFDTQRFLLTGQLTGEIKWGNFILSPFARLTYFEEQQDAYVDSQGNTITKETFTLGRLSFGPRLSTKYNLSDMLTLAPHISIAGVWDFDPLDETLINDDLRARVEGGFALSVKERATLSASSFYDGIGQSNVETYGGSIQLRVSF